jgi:AcrR family transcriptional regulator
MLPGISMQTSMSTPVEGRRERKKRERRDAIARHALALFAAQGFDSVTIREIAEAADVSEPTVFNYFPTKESLVFHQDQAREAAMIEAVRERAEGTAVLVAFEACALAFLDSFEWPVTFVQFVRVVQASPRLQQYRREVYARHAQALAACVRQEDPTLDAVTAASLALALMGVAVAASENLGQRVMAGQALRRAARATRTDAERAFALLARGLADFGVQEPMAARGRRAR